MDSINGKFDKINHKANMNLNKEIKAYNNSRAKGDREICEVLAREINRALREWVS
jgi:hypothetical protein